MHGVWCLTLAKKAPVFLDLECGNRFWCWCCWYGILVLGAHRSWCWFTTLWFSIRSGWISQWVRKTLVKSESYFFWRAGGRWWWLFDTFCVLQNHTFLVKSAIILMTFKLRQWMLKLFFEVPDYKIARRQRGRKAAHDLLDITLVNEVRCRNFWLRCAFPMFWMTNVLLESTDDLKRKIQKSSFFAGWLGKDLCFVFPICLSLAFLSARWKEVKETISLSQIRWPGLHLIEGLVVAQRGTVPWSKSC